MSFFQKSLPLFLKSNVVNLAKVSSLTPQQVTPNGAFLNYHNRSTIGITPNGVPESRTKAPLGAALIGVLSMFICYLGVSPREA